ncbi:glycoside hydrolase superfamily [Xylariaceae sp. FL0016]|nr:glycoside hydrolase superfamily [Xylariaceae sp. FL0016]
MKCFSFLSLLPATGVYALSSRSSNQSTDQWPYAPFRTQGRHIVNSHNESVTWAGVNWPLSGETMIPEGVEYQSVSDILDLVKSAGFNMLRMPYAIEMVDQIYEGDGEDVSLEVSLVNGMGAANGTRVAQMMIAQNPTWSLQTTRFEIWSDIARTALEKGILIHPDVHVGKAMWCCSNVDGNAWFDSFHFPADKWRRGLAHVAAWAKAHPNVVSMSLRNELRPSYNITELVDDPLQYNWQTYAGNMTAGAYAVHEANPDILISWSGMQFDEDLSGVVTGKNLMTHSCYHCDVIKNGYTADPLYFNLDDHPFADKVYWELHMYTLTETVDTDNCDITEAELYRRGFNALGIEAPDACELIGDCEKANRLTPVVLTEFGREQDADLFNETLINCLKDYTIRNDVSWMMWALPGIYRVREGGQFVLDTWSLTNDNFSGWGYPEGVEGFWSPWAKKMNVTTLP